MTRLPLGCGAHSASTPRRQVPTGGAAAAARCCMQAEASRPSLCSADAGPTGLAAHSSGGAAQVSCQTTLSAHLYSPPLVPPLPLQNARTPACSRAAAPCAQNQTCIPTRDDYDLNADPEGTVPPLGFSHWVKCRRALAGGGRRRHAWRASRPAPPPAPALKPPAHAAAPECAQLPPRPPHHCIAGGATLSALSPSARPWREPTRRWQSVAASSPSAAVRAGRKPRGRKRRHHGHHTVALHCPAVQNKIEAPASARPRRRRPAACTRTPAQAGT